MEQKYCKHCGNLLGEQGTICTHCGFDGSIGSSFCGHCGKHVEEGQVLCIGCGHLLRQDPNIEKDTGKTGEAVENSEKEKYKQYIPSMMKIRYLTIAECCVAVLFSVLLAFLPIFKFKCVPELDDIEDLEQFAEAMTSGYLEEELSFFDIARKCEIVKSSAVTIEIIIGLSIMAVALDSMCSIMQGLFGLWLMVGWNIPEATIFRYDAIKKGCDHNVMRKRPWYGKGYYSSMGPNVVVSCIIDVISITAILLTKESITLPLGKTSEYVLSRLSPFSYILVLLSVSLLLIFYIKHAETKIMKTAIEDE